MFKVINLNELKNGKKAIETFDNEREAIIYINGLANAFSITGYRIASLPTSRGISYDDPQMLVVKKKIDEYDDNSEEESILFALMSYEYGEYLSISNDRGKDTWGREEDANYSIKRIAAKPAEMYERIVKNRYSLIKSQDGICYYKTETDDFISEIYIIEGRDFGC